MNQPKAEGTYFVYLCVCFSSGSLNQGNFIPHLQLPAMTAGNIWQFLEMLIVTTTAI